jgi:hypothetical protein
MVLAVLGLLTRFWLGTAFLLSRWAMRKFSVLNPARQRAPSARMQGAG